MLWEKYVLVAAIGDVLLAGCSDGDGGGRTRQM
jgi:hypothetical protein